METSTGPLRQVQTSRAGVELGNFEWRIGAGSDPMPLGVWWVSSAEAPPGHCDSVWSHITLATLSLPAYPVFPHLWSFPVYVAYYTCIIVTVLVNDLTKQVSIYAQNPSYLSLGVEQGET